jgi:hypothetical protein
MAIFMGCLFGVVLAVAEAKLLMAEVAEVARFFSLWVALSLSQAIFPPEEEMDITFIVITMEIGGKAALAAREAGARFA